MGNVLNIWAVAALDPIAKGTDFRCPAERNRHGEIQWGAVVLETAGFSRTVGERTSPSQTGRMYAIASPPGQTGGTVRWRLSFWRRQVMMSAV